MIYRRFFASVVVLHKRAHGIYGVIYLLYSIVVVGGVVASGMVVVPNHGGCWL